MKTKITNATRKNIDHGKHPDPIIRQAWQRGLKALQPTKKQLEHGLELHAHSFACDIFGFLPNRNIWTKEVGERWNELMEGHVGARELSEQMAIVRGTAITRDPRAAEEFCCAIRASGLKCMVQTVAGGKSRQEDISHMATFQQVCRVLRKTLTQAGSAAEIREANMSGKLAIVWSVNGPPLVGQLQDLDEEMSWIDTWYNLGVRLMHMTYNRRNFVGDGCAEPANGGLSDLGRDLIRKLNATGIIVDVPHSGRRTTLEAAQASSKPIMASHTGARGVFDHMRCKSDEELKAIAATEGLVGVYALPSMLGPDATLNTMLDHIDHVVKVAGVEHVGIGTDSCYQQPWPKEVKGYSNPRFKGNTWWGNWKPENHPLSGRNDEAQKGSLFWTNWPLYTVGLVMRGYSDKDIEKILGGNFLRVLEANRNQKEVR